MTTIEIKDIQLKADKFVTNILNDSLSVLSNAMQNFKYFNKSSLNLTEISIINHINSDFKKFILQTPEEHASFIQTWKTKNPNLFFDPRIKGKDKTTPFCKNILKSLNYTKFRNKHCNEFAEIIGIKTCPYCNAMLTIVTKNGKARLQLDHFYPKTKYPYLSISLFNLIPTCSNCNLIKTNKDVTLGNNFHLYSNKTPFDAFKFKLEDADIVKNIIGVSQKDVKVLFTHKKMVDEQYVKNHNKIFDIQGIYNTQNDIVEELIWCSQAYNKTKRDEIKKLLKIDDSTMNRLIVRNYMELENIHKRPMSKFMQDIAEDLELI